LRLAGRLELAEKVEAGRELELAGKVEAGREGGASRQDVRKTTRREPG
jgi:hypothetical protein